MEVDDLADGSLTIIPARDIALMDADLGAVTGRRQFGEELLCLFVFLPYPAATVAP